MEKFKTNWILWNESRWFISDLHFRFGGKKSNIPMASGNLLGSIPLKYQTHIFLNMYRHMFALSNHLENCTSVSNWLLKRFEDFFLQYRHRLKKKCLHKINWENKTIYLIAKRSVNVFNGVYWLAVRDIQFNSDNSERYDSKWLRNENIFVFGINRNGMAVEWHCKSDAQKRVYNMPFSKRVCGLFVYVWWA